MFKEHEEKILSFATEAMTSDEDLWHCYYKDFITSKLKPIDVPSKDEIGEHNFFKNLDRSSDMLERVIKLHCSVNIKQFNLDQLAAILRPLSKVCDCRRGMLAIL